jgi:23S rRNA (guanosine2251-2'-O)-methyltransferase
VRERCDYLIMLPMRGQVASLNAATAGAVMLYSAWQARGYEGV